MKGTTAVRLRTALFLFLSYSSQDSASSTLTSPAQLRLPQRFPTRYSNEVDFSRRIARSFEYERTRCSS